MTDYEESRIIREITHFLTAKGHFIPFDLGYFLDLTVFTLLCYKGKKSVKFPPCLHSILNTYQQTHLHIAV